MAKATTTAIQIAMAYASNHYFRPSRDTHRELLDRFETWDRFSEDLADYAEAVERWAGNRSFNNWYEMVDTFAQTYAEYRLVEDDFNEIIKIATRREPPDEA